MDDGSCSNMKFAEFGPLDIMCMIYRLYGYAALIRHVPYSDIALTTLTIGMVALALYVVIDESIRRFANKHSKGQFQWRWPMSNRESSTDSLQLVPAKISY